MDSILVSLNLSPISDGSSDDDIWYCLVTRLMNEAIKTAQKRYWPPAEGYVRTIFGPRRTLTRPLLGGSCFHSVRLWGAQNMDPLRKYKAAYRKQLTPNQLLSGLINATSPDKKFY